MLEACGSSSLPQNAEQIRPVGHDQVCVRSAGGFLVMAHVHRGSHPARIQEWILELSS